MSRRRSRTGIVSFLSVLLLPAIAARAQSIAALAPVQIESQLKDGDTTIAGSFPSGVVSNLIAVRIDATDTTIQQFTPRVDGQRFRIRLKVELRAGQDVELRYLVSGGWSPWSSPGRKVAARHPTDFLYAYLEDDDPFMAEAFLGVNLDNFSTTEAKSAIGEATGNSVTTRPRMASGFNLSYRIFGSSHSDRQVWIYSRAAFAARSGEALCSKDPDSSQTTCLLGQSATGAPGQVFKIIEHAASVEVLNGFRWDLATIQPASANPTKFYVLAELGPLLLSGVDRSANEWIIGGGLRIPAGRFRDTRVDIGAGGSDYFTKRYPRFKVNGFLAFPVAGALRFFAEVRTDATLDVFHGGKDPSVSLITTLGFHLEVNDLFK